MADFDRERRELHLQVLYAGPPGSGKSTSLEVIRRAAAKHGRAQPPDAGDAPALEHVQLALGRVFGRHTAVAHLFAPSGGRVLDPTARRLLRSADAVVFVADATPGRAEDNARALSALEAELRREGRDLWDLPLVFQWNKRDLLQRRAPDAPPLCRGRPCIPTLALKGEGVVTAFQRVCLPALRAAGEEHDIAPTRRTARPRSQRDPRDPVAAAVDELERESVSVGADAPRPPVLARLLGRARAMFR